MKKTRKVLSLVLAMLVAFSSMPLVYTGTAAAEDAIPYAEATGTIDNPTRPVSESGEYSQSETNHLTALQKSLNFVYYQTIDNEYFGLSQIFQMEKYCGWQESSTVMLNSYNFDADDKTNNFFNKHEATYSWTPAANESAATAFPGSFEIEGTVVYCPDYSWDLDVVFKGHSANESGEINTGYTQILDYTTTVEEVATSYPTAISTTVKILDARELAKEIAEAEYILANPDDYTEKYLASVEATLNTIPEDLRDFSKVYDQSVIDSYTQMMVDISLNSADYREYNELYKSLKSINNSKGAFTEDSFLAFKAEIERINANLPKNLDKTQQAAVDTATQALRDAYDNILVSTDLSSSNIGFTYTSNGDDGDMNFTIDNTAFKFMQIEDNQVFQYSQMWSIRRNGGSTDRNFGGMILQTSALSGVCDNSACLSNQTPSTNNTQSFVDRLTSDSYATITARNEVGVINNANTTFTAPEFLCWKEYTSADATTPKDTTIIDTSGSYTGALDSNRDYQYSNNTTYYLENSPKFTGNPAGQYGEISMNYVMRTGWSYTTGGIFGWLGTKHSSHIHVNTTIDVTDVRQLISAVAEAEEVLANPGSHSENYLTALQAAVDSVPVEMLRGVEYYTQAEVDKLYNDITLIPEQVADYSEFVEVFEMMTSLNKDKYTEDSYNTFLAEIYAINQNLAKNLTVDNQATVDAAVDALYAAYNKLVSRHLNEDSVFTQDDIDEALGNSPLEFSISSTQNNFVQIVDGQKFAIRTEITARKTRTNYNCSLLALRFSSVTADTVESICAGRSSPDAGCHNGESILINQSELVLTGVTGVNAYTANDAGDIGEHNTWVNTKGVALSTNGIFNDPTNLSTSDSSAYAEMYYTGVSGNQELFNAQIDATIALRLGWSYSETFLGVAGESIRRHVHFPVSIQITDARALHSLYNEVGDILNGKTEDTYTLGSLLNLYYAYIATNEGLANGEVYVPQEEANAEYAKLKAAYDALQEGADYSEYFETYVKAQEIISTNNDDGYGNKLYDEETFNTFVETVETINNALDKNLSDTTDNQAIVDAATGSLNEAITTLEETKRADYTKLEEVIAKAEKIINASEDTYTNETLDVLKEALNNANALDRELPASEQATVDAITSALEAAVEDMEFRADYSEFDEAYDKIQEIVNAPEGTYTDETVQAAKDALAEADKLNKDLPDTAQNRVTIESTVNELNKVLDDANEKADYSDFEEALEDAKEIVNAPEGTYTDKTVDAAKDAIDRAEELDKDLTKNQQATVDEVTNALKDAVNNAEEKADYSEFEEFLEDAKEIVNAPEGTYTDETVKNAQDAIDAAEALDKDLSKDQQATVDDVTNSLKDAVTNAEEKADYSEFEEALEDAKEIVNAPEGTYTDETVKNAQDAIDAAEALDKDLSKDQQTTVDDVTNSLKDAVTNAEEKADYSEFDKVVEELENIVNNPDDYTDETVQSAKDALEEAEKLDKDLSADDQEIVDEVTSNLQDVIDSVVERADYSDFNAAVEELDKILNAPEGTYTDSTIEAAQAAKDAADALDKNLPAGEQTVVDSVTDEINNVVNNAQEKADYTDYNAAKDATDKLVNDDGNGNPIYDEEAFQEYKDKVVEIDNALDKNLSKSEENQATIDKATQDLEDLKATLEESRIPTSIIIDSETDVNEVVDEILKDYNADEIIVEYKNYLGEELANANLVGTGSTMRVILKSTGEILDYRMFIIMGDVDGDGDVDADDYQQSVNVGLEFEAYAEEHYYFFIANDMDADGVIDVIDTAIIRRMYK